MVNRKSFLKGLAAGGAAVAAGSAFGHETYHAKPYGGRVTGAGKPLKDVVVTDGRTCVLTDRNGWFRLPANDKVRFVTITVPAGWRIPRHYIRFASHERQYDFELEPWAPSAKDGFSFMHIGDSEIGNDLKLERTWVERAKKFADERDAAFFVHTGDITAQMGDLHLRLMNERTVGRPVFYVVGNHDVIRETYGEEIFEETFGPCWYSFDCGTTHFVVTPMMWGDGNPSYSVAEIEDWLANDLAIAKKKGQGVLLLIHGAYDSGVFDASYVFDRSQLSTKGPKKIDVMKACDFHGIVHGHFHTNYFRRSLDRRIEVISGAPPLKQFSTLQLITVDAAHRMTCENRYGHVEWPKVPEPKECVWRHCVDAAVSNRLAVDERNVYLGTLDYCGKDTAGAFALDRKTGEQRWFFPTSSEVGTEVILHKGRAYVQEGNWVVHCLDAATGREIFKVDPRQAIGLIGQTLLGGMSGNTSSTMTLDEKNNRMFAGQAYLKLYAFDLGTGKIVWQPDSKRGHVLNTPSRPVLAGGNVLVASAMWDGLIGYDLATGKEIWSHRRNDSRVTSEWYASGYPWLERWGFPVLKDGLLYLVTGNEFMEVDPKTGEAKRRYTFDFSVKCFTAPIFRGERAYFGTPRNGLVCFDLKTFKPIWTSQVEEALVVYLPYENPPMKSLSSIPVFWKGLVWATAQDGAVYGWDTETGRRVHRIATGVPFLTSACVGPDDRLYTADFLGNVRCFDLNGRCAWIVVPKRRRRA